MIALLNSAAGTVLEFLLVASVGAVVLTCGAWLLIRVGGIRAAVHRHAIWLVCLIGIAALPPLWLYAPKVKLPVLPAERPAIAPVQEAVRAVPPILVTPPVTPITFEASLPRAATAVEPARPFPFKPLIACLWAAGVSIMLARLAFGWMRMCRVRRRARRFDGVRIGSKVHLLASPEIVGPVCTGIWRPSVLVPEAFLKSPEPNEIQMVLRHELAHIARGDCVVNAAQRLVEAAFFFHPVVWYASLKLTQERERVCDDCVLAQGSRPDDYAELLSRMAEQGYERTLSRSLALTEGGLLLRIRHILDPQRRRLTALSLGAAAACFLAALCLVGFGLVRLAHAQSQAAGAAKSNATGALRLVLEGSEKAGSLLYSGRGVTKAVITDDKGQENDQLWYWSFKGACFLATHFDVVNRQALAAEARPATHKIKERLLLTPELFAAYDVQTAGANIYPTDKAASYSDLLNPLNSLSRRSGKTLSEIIRNAGEKASARETELDGRRLFLVETPAPGDQAIKELYWVDPAKNFAIVRMERTQENGRYKQVQQVELTEIKPGLCFPAKSVAVDSNKDPGSDKWVDCRQETCTFESVEVNVEMDDGLFTPERMFFRGMHVSDQRNSPPLTYLEGIGPFPPATITRETLFEIVKAHRDSIVTYDFKFNGQQELLIRTKDSMNAVTGPQTWSQYEEISSGRKFFRSTQRRIAEPPWSLETWNQGVHKSFRPGDKFSQIEGGQAGSSIFPMDSSPLYGAMFCDSTDKSRYPGFANNDIVAMLKNVSVVLTAEKHGSVDAVCVIRGGYRVGLDRAKPEGIELTLKTWLDPQRGYVVLDHLRELGSGKDATPWSRVENLKFQDCGNGLWLPIETRITGYLPPGSPDGKPGAVASVTKTKTLFIELNKEYADEQFDIQFPPGAMVHDEIKGIDYWVERMEGKP